jgi:probable HAF family extracellular repeat protein
MEDLGVLPGGSWSSAYAINDEGRIVGYGLNGSGLFRAFVSDPRLGLLELGTLGGSSSYAFGINGAGQIVGHSSVAGGYLHAYLFSDGAMRDLGTLGGGQSYAYGINSGGDVVGHSWLAGSASTHAFLYRDGSMTDLNALIGADSGWALVEAYAINDRGQIAGAGLFNGRMSAYRLDPVPAPSPQFASMLGPPPAATPEPATMVMLVLGLAVLAASGWLKKHGNR